MQNAGKDILRVKPNLTPELREYISRFADPKLLLRAMLVLAVLELGALLLGVAFFIIIQGLFLGVAWFFLYWKPAFAIFTKSLNIEDVEFMRLPIPWWRVILLGIKALIILFLICFGTQFLFTHGFLDQNLIYQLISH